MPNDASTMSNDELIAIANGNSQDSPDTSNLSNEELMKIAGEPQQQQNLSPTDKAVQVIGQMGKAAYSNPIMHPAMKLLSDITGSNADQLYGALPQPQGVMEKVASGVGAAAPMIAITAPIMDAVGGMLGAADAVAASSGLAKSVPVLTKLTSFLKNSDLAKSAIGGYAYGKAEATMMQAEGQNIDPEQYAQDTAKQFLLWGGLTRGGATLAAKFLPKELPAVQSFVANMPDSVKKAFTPEGIGSIAGGALAGAINAPDKQSGIAGAIVGGALSAMNPSEKFQFKVGMGKGLGTDGVAAVTDRWGIPFRTANDVIKKYGFDKVEEVGKATTADGENAIHIAAKTQIDNYNKTWNDLHIQTQPVLQEMDNKALAGIDTINMINGIKNMIDTKFRTPGYLSKVKGAFDSAYPALQAIELPTATAKKYGIAPEDYKGDTFRTSISELNKITDPALKMRAMQQLTKAQLSTGIPDTSSDFRNRLSDVSFQALDELRQNMNKISQGNDPYESGVAGKIAQVISNHMKMKSNLTSNNGEPGPYTRLMANWNNLFRVGDLMGETQDYQKLSQKLSNPHWSQNDTTKRNSENNLKSIDKYFISQGKTPVKDMLDQYHAYHTYANPMQEGLTKTFALRQISSAVVGGILTPIVGPAGGLAAALTSYHMGSPEAWLPVLKGASIAEKKR